MITSPKDIKMVDIPTEHLDFQDDLQKAITTSLLEGKYINGPEVSSFSEKLSSYLSVKHVIPCANGTDALTIALKSLGLQPGDEVLVPSFNYVAAAESIALLGLKPVFTDVDYSSFNALKHHFEAKKTAKTKALIAVHLFGQSSDMQNIITWAKEHHIFVIEDVAQSLGATHRDQLCGTYGDIGITSFFPTKNLGGLGDGGAIFTQNEEFASRCKQIASHGQSKKYYFDQVGMNSRLDTLQAAALLIKIHWLEDRLHKRKANGAYYQQHLFNSLVELPVILENNTHTYNQYTLKIQNGMRDRFASYLKKHHIPFVIYYPIPLHLQKAYHHFISPSESFPVSEQLCKEVVSIPVHPMLQKEELNYICEIIQNFKP